MYNLFKDFKKYRKNCWEFLIYTHRTHYPPSPPMHMHDANQNLIDNAFAVSWHDSCSTAAWHGCCFARARARVPLHACDECVRREGAYFPV